MKLSLAHITVAFLFAFSAHAAPAKKLRVGWQVPWTVQGQIVQVLKHTDILKKNNLEVEFIGKTFGPELNEVALSGGLDFLLTADQPAAILFSKSADWQGIGRLMYNRTSSYAPPASSLKEVSALAGKTVGVPFGAAAQRVLHEALAEAKVDAEKVKFVNLGMLEHAPLISKAGPGAAKWDQFDALSGFDPIPAILEAKGQVRTIHEGKVCAMVIGNKTFLKENPKVGEALLKAIGEAYAYYRSHRSEVNKWFTEEARLSELSDAAAAVTEKFEPNLKKGAKIRLSFSDDDLVLMQKGADFMKKVTGTPVPMKDFVTNDFVPKAYR